MDLTRTKAEIARRDTSRSSYVSDDRWRLAKSQSKDVIERLFDQNKEAIVDLLEKVGHFLADGDLTAGKSAMRSGVIEALEESADAFLTNRPSGG